MDTKYEKSCGALVVKDSSVLLIQSVLGHWGFPKGHVEENESEIETAVRETKEETNIDVIIDESFKMVIDYQPKEGVLKTVVYFLATPLSNEIVPQIVEVKNVAWFPFIEAVNKITYDNERGILLSYLSKHYFEFDTLVERTNGSSVKWDTYPGMLPFWVADSDYPCFKRIGEVLIEQAKHGAFGYTYVNDEVKKAVANWYYQFHQLQISLEQIMMTTGVVTSIIQILQYLKEEKWLNKLTVIVQNPVYHTFYQAIKAVGYQTVLNPLMLPDYEIDLEHLESLFIQGHRVLILCSPHNPTGRVYTKATLKKLVELIIKYNVFLISDEIHSDIIVSEVVFTPILRVFKEMGNTTYPHLVICNAASKTFNVAGLNTAYMIIPNETFKKALALNFTFHLYEQPTVLGLEALKVCYNEGQLWMKCQNRYLYENYQLVKQYISDYLPSAIVNNLEATYLLWVDLRAYGPKRSLKDKLIKANIVFSLGEQFDQHFIGFVRINLATPQSQLLKMLKLLKEYL